MTEMERLDQLRELLLTAPEQMSTRIIAVTGSLLLLGTVLWLVRKRSLRAEYTPIWLAVAFGVVIVCLSRPLLTALTRSIGAWTPSSAIFFFGEAFLVAICLGYAVRLSGLTHQIKVLTQEIAILRSQVGEVADTRQAAEQA